MGGPPFGLGDDLVGALLRAADRRHAVAVADVLVVVGGDHDVLDRRGVADLLEDQADAARGVAADEGERG